MVVPTDYPVGSQPMFPRDFSSGGDTPDNINDREWIKRSFMIGDKELGEQVYRDNRYWSSAAAKFTDSRLGCNIGINCRPQLSPYTDIRVKGRLQGRVEPSVSDTSGNYGMGRYFSEAYDDPAQIVYLRFGVPQYNGLMNFLSKAFDINASSVARTGRVPSILYDASKMFGSYLALKAFPAVSLTILVGKAAGAIFARPNSKFYTLKPTMYQYWSAVNQLVNTIAINAGIFPKIVDNGDDSQKIGRPYKLDEEYLDLMSQGMPDIFRDNRHFDVFALANAAQRLANQVYMDDYERLNKSTPTTFTGYVLKKNSGNGTHSTAISNQDGSVKFGMKLNAAVSAVNIWDLVKKSLDFSDMFRSPGKDAAGMEADGRIDKDGKQAPAEKKQGFLDFFDAEFRMGAAFAVFRVDHTGPVSESFSSSVTESDLSQKLNGVSSTFQQARFSLAQGNLIGGMVGEAIGGALNLAGDVVQGGLSGVTLGAVDLVKGLMGDGYIDIPKHWQSSSASLPEQTYSMELVAPYGNVMSWLINCVLPMCMVLAGALPRSIGKQSYTSPFLCQLFDRGRCQIRLGMMDSVTITRGTGDLAFTTDGRPLAINVSFRVKDLSSILHMPISTGRFFDGADMTLDEDNILSDYLAVVAGQDMYSQIYPIAQGRMRWAKLVMAAQKYTSPAWRAAAIHDIMTSGPLTPIGSVIEGLARGSETTAGAI